MAPHDPIEADWYDRNNKAYSDLLAKEKSPRMRERYLLAGLLTSWLFLYNETPPASSWIWQWYPDGEEWRGVSEERNFSLATIKSVMRKYKNAS